MILSVPHSGTRTLKVYLGRVPPSGEGDQAAVMRHFGLHENWAGWYDYVDIPVRDPFDVALSWQIRYEGFVGDDAKQPPRMIQLFDMMVMYPEIPEKARPWANVNPDVEITYWNVHELPQLEGRGNDHEARHDREIARELPWPRAVVEWYNSRSDVREFYARFFDSFWWSD